MREIQVAENKTLKLTNVLARKIDASELGNLGVILTQMQNFIKSHSAMPVSRRSRPSSASTCACNVTSSAVVGSSAISRSGSPASASAIIARCRMPPES